MRNRGILKRKEIDEVFRKNCLKYDVYYLSNLNVLIWAKENKPVKTETEFFDIIHAFFFSKWKRFAYIQAF